MGVGSLLGRLTWWIGKKMIKSLVTLQIIRSLRETEKLVGLLNRMSFDDRNAYFDRKPGKIIRASGDLLELSQSVYFMFKTSWCHYLRVRYTAGNTVQISKKGRQIFLWLW